MPAVGSAWVDLVLNDKAFTSGLSSAEAKMHGFAASAGRSLVGVGNAAKTLGSTMTRYISLPLVGIGAVAIKMALDFDKAMTKVGALTQGGAKDMQNLRQQVLNLAGATAQAPVDLANALYFIESAGIHGAKAMNVLTISAKDAASGLGTTATVADLLTSAINSYGSSALSATKASDALVAAVAAGKMPADVLAGALGQLLPLGSKLHISFAQLAGILAELSKQGIPVTRGVTGLRFAMMALVNPSGVAAKAMKEFGVSAADVAKSVQSGSPTSLIDTLQKLWIASGRNVGNFAKMVGGTRAMSVALPLLGNKLADTRDVMAQVANATGKTGAAFEATAKGPAFRAEQALNNLKVAAVELGQKLLPIAMDVVKVVDKIATAFSVLPAGAQKSIVAFGLIAIAAGPLIRIFGSIVGGLGKLILKFGSAGAAKDTFAKNVTGNLVPALTGATEAAGVSAGAMVGLGAAFVGIGAALAVKLNPGIRKADQNIRDFGVSTGQTQQSVGLLGHALGRGAAGFIALDAAAYRAKQATLASSGAFASGTDQLKSMNAAAAAAAASVRNIPTIWKTDYYFVQIGGNQKRTAHGGIFKAAGGAEFMSVGGPFIAGEGGYATPAGIGAEIVGSRGILPLDYGTFDNIGKALARHIGGGAGAGGPQVHLHFHGPIAEDTKAFARRLAPDVSRELGRLSLVKRV